MTNATPALPPPGGNPSSGWQVLGQTPGQSGQDASGATVPGVILHLLTGAGDHADVFIPKTMYDAASAAIAAFTRDRKPSREYLAIGRMHAWIDAKVATHDYVRTIQGEL